MGRRGSWFCLGLKGELNAILTMWVLGTLIDRKFHDKYLAFVDFTLVRG